MKFFKHFTDAHRGKSLQGLLRKWDKERGMKAIGMYWTLVELCAEKLEKEKDEEFTAAHCVFEFDLRYIRDTLQVHQTSTLLMYLRCFEDVGLMSLIGVNDVLTISMPKLLECLDRDTKRARSVRAPCAPKIKNKEEDKEEDKDKEKYKKEIGVVGDEELAEAFRPAATITRIGVSAAERQEAHFKFDLNALFKEYPRYQKKTESLGLLTEYVKNQEDYDLVLKAIRKYREHCVRLGTEFSKTLTFPNWWPEWRDWLDPLNGVETHNGGQSIAEMITEFEEEKRIEAERRGGAR